MKIVEERVSAVWIRLVVLADHLGAHAATVSPRLIQLVEFNTGHFMMAEDPDRFRALLGDFLKGLHH